MAISGFKSLFAGNLEDKDQENKQEIQQEELNLDSPSKKSYEEWGFEKGKHLNGSESGLRQTLDRVKEDYKAISIDNVQQQAKRKEPWVREREAALEEITHLEEEKEDLLKVKNKSLLEKIEALKKEVIAIQKDSSSILVDKVSKVNFYIGLVILMALTAYLFIFYSSASFSAFFKEFTLNEIGVASSIFDPQAISIAYQDGATELGLILLMPAIFIGLGFLIHKFQEKQGIGKYFKIGFLVAVTFAFDVILAYEITEKIYNIKAENSFAEVTPYNFSIAFESINFWLIIFAGFVVYIIWGFIFDITMEAYDNLNVVQRAIRARESEMEIYKEDISKNEQKSDVLKQEINKLKLQVKELKLKIDAVFIDVTEFDKVLHEFLGGWIHWMTANKKSKTDIDKAIQIGEGFIKNNLNFAKKNNNLISE